MPKTASLFFKLKLSFIESLLYNQILIPIILDNQELEMESYDEELVRRLIEKIVVYDEKLKVVFKSGIEIDINK